MTPHLQPLRSDDDPLHELALLAERRRILRAELADLEAIMVGEMEGRMALIDISDAEARTILQAIAASEGHLPLLSDDLTRDWCKQRVVLTRKFESVLRLIEAQMLVVKLATELTKRGGTDET